MPDEKKPEADPAAVETQAILGAVDATGSPVPTPPASAAKPDSPADEPPPAGETHAAGKAAGKAD